MRLSQKGEPALLDEIKKMFTKRTQGLKIGIGDDSAVISQIGKNLAITTDMMLEGVHFKLNYISPYQLGFKLISVNVSDVYAMAGKPYYVLLNIALRGNTEYSFIRRFFDGVRDALTFYKCSLIGGDLSSSQSGMVLSAMVLGYAEKPISRSGAMLGDKLYVTGNLGDSCAGLLLLKEIKKHINFNKPLNKPLRWSIMMPLIRKHLMPVAKDPMAFTNYITSMIDISDGLLIDLSRLLDESNVGARIYEERIPISKELREFTLSRGITPSRLSLRGGEDYELLFTASPKKKINAICIGEITKKDRIIVDKDGREKLIKPEGYKHFETKR